MRIAAAIRRLAGARARAVMAAAVLAAATLSAAVAPARAASAKGVPHVVVIGIDGMDPLLLEKFEGEGRMPHFEALAKSGSYSHLGTSIPPQSPVAWSDFITGMDPGGHGIFDFIHRDPATYMPIFSAALVTAPSKVLTIGDWVIPLKSGETKLLRHGEAFWQMFDAHHVPYTVFRVPANFPPARAAGKTMSGMGTPDLLGTYGTFSFYTNDDLYQGMDVSGGTIYPVQVTGNHVHADLVGPPNSLKKGGPTLKCPFSVDIDPTYDAARFTVGNHAFLLQTGEWSQWMTIDFDLVGPFKKLHGIARFYLKSVRPYFDLYVTPINIDPLAPALPISTPANYSRDIARRIGLYYTQGMPEDTKALEYGMFDDAEFVHQTDIVLAERRRMLDATLDDYQHDGGFLFFYISIIDQSSHMLWRNYDPKHPAHHAGIKFQNRLRNLYAQMDSLLGVVMKRIPDDATLMVMSDHGFAPFYKKFNLNTWLYKNGYLALIRPDEIGKHPLFGNVFWRRTKAYGLGINGLYINELGREGKGIVRAAEADDLMDEISQKLLAVRDPENGEPVITHVYRSSKVYHGDQLGHAPDMVVGYNRGYRCSDESALGTLSETVLAVNLSKWSGDHCMDNKLVPGIFLSNRPLLVSDPNLKDLPTTILALYGIKPLPAMRGRVILPTSDTRSEQHVRR